MSWSRTHRAPTLKWNFAIVKPPSAGKGEKQPMRRRIPPCGAASEILKKRR
jgi:hypothetical protein